MGSTKISFRSHYNVVFWSSFSSGCIEGSGIGSGEHVSEVSSWWVSTEISGRNLAKSVRERMHFSLTNIQNSDPIEWNGVAEEAATLRPSEQRTP